MSTVYLDISIGDGVRLFENLGPDRIELDRVRTIETPSATHLRFTVGKATS